ncbi:MAG: SIR2 family protein, partial [Methanobacteriaceae archaeon]|nr:SIR2 family protein [Methanobacteriaceae archaeon]
VFIFGAGASAAENAPTIANFLSEAYRLFGDEKKYPEFTRVWRFIIESFSKPIRGYQYIPDSFPSIDELFSLIDYCLLTNTSLTRQHNIETIFQIKKDLISLMSLTLKETAKTCDIHYGFLKRHLEAFGGCDIISLNYDTLLDNALARIVKRKNINYGFDSRPSFKNVKKQYRLFKLHGSLNWGSCTLCKTITTFDSDIAHKIDESYPCAGCSHHSLEPVIITPTLLKDYNITSLHNVWNSAFKVISKCDVLVFIGYSLNPSDLAIIHLLKRALSAAGNKLKKIVVVDKDNLGNRTTRIRYQKIFGEEIHYIPDGFQKNLDINEIVKK